LAAEAERIAHRRCLHREDQTAQRSAADGLDCPAFSGSIQEIKPSTTSIFSSTDSKSCYKKSR
jgi:hypothetical protein